MVVFADFGLFACFRLKINKRCIPREMGVFKEKRRKMHFFIKKSCFCQKSPYNEFQGQGNNNNKAKQNELKKINSISNTSINEV